VVATRNASDAFLVGFSKILRGALYLQVAPLELEDAGVAGYYTQKAPDGARDLHLT